MSALSWLFGRMQDWTDRTAIVSGEAVTNYPALLRRISEFKLWLKESGIQSGQSVCICADFSPDSIALLLAAWDSSLIAALRAPSTTDVQLAHVRLAEAAHLIWFDDAGSVRHSVYEQETTHPLLTSLAESGHAGLILFSSGSTGMPKASVHDVGRFLEKFQQRRSPLSAVAVPPMDHVAGLDTLLYSLSSGGSVICVPNRNPETVCSAIERRQAELLPASAAFLNLLLLSEAYLNYDLSSVRVVAYGSDVMPANTLNRLRTIMPSATFLQKYGTTEFGSPRTTCKEDGSLWLKIDDVGFSTKVVDGTLWVRAQSAMLGYLNAPNPFDDEGWINTQDAVEVDGEYMRILGRKSDLINVGGHKIYPAEVENSLLQLDNVADVVVFGARNAIMGQVVAARFRLNQPEDFVSFKRRVRDWCKGTLAPYKIPVSIEISEADLVTSRHKKQRGIANG